MKCCILILLMALVLKTQAEEGHNHSEGEVHAEHEEHAHDDHAEEEESHVVGPEKGILAKGRLGMKLSAEAIKAFGVTTMIISKNDKYRKTAIVNIKADKFLYRLKDGWIKRISVKNANNGDEIIVTGCSFIRAAELVASEGVAHGHSH